MSLDIFLENDRGESLAEISDPDNLISNLIKNVSADMILLKYIDPYGDTMFNHIQSNDLIHDLNYLENITTDCAAVDLISHIRELVLKLQNGKHLYLKIYGD